MINENIVTNTIISRDNIHINEKSITSSIAKLSHYFGKN